MLRWLKRAREHTTYFYKWNLLLDSGTEFSDWGRFCGKFYNAEPQSTCSLMCWCSHLTLWICSCTYTGGSQNASLHLFCTVQWWLTLEYMFLFSGLLCIKISNTPTNALTHTLHTRSYLWCIIRLLAITKLWHSVSTFFLAHHLVAHQQFTYMHTQSSFAPMWVVLLWMCVWLSSCNQACSRHQLLPLSSHRSVQRHFSICIQKER